MGSDPIDGAPRRAGCDLPLITATPEIARMVDVGSPAPDFTVLTDEGKETSLRDYRGHWVVLYFYPKADTPG